MSYVIKSSFFLLVFSHIFLFSMQQLSDQALSDKVVENLALISFLHTAPSDMSRKILQDQSLSFLSREVKPVAPKQTTLLEVVPVWNSNQINKILLPYNGYKHTLWDNEEYARCARNVGLTPPKLDSTRVVGPNKNNIMVINHHLLDVSDVKSIRKEQVAILEKNKETVRYLHPSKNVFVATNGHNIGVYDTSQKKIARYPVMLYCDESVQKGSWVYKEKKVQLGPDKTIFMVETSFVNMRSTSAISKGLSVLAQYDYEHNNKKQMIGGDVVHFDEQQNGLRVICLYSKMIEQWNDLKNTKDLDKTTRERLGLRTLPINGILAVLDFDYSESTPNEVLLECQFLFNMDESGMQQVSTQKHFYVLYSFKEKVFRAITPSFHVQHKLRFSDYKMKKACKLKLNKKRTNHTYISVLFPNRENITGLLLARAAHYWLQQKNKDNFGGRIILGALKNPDIVKNPDIMQNKWHFVSRTRNLFKGVHLNLLSEEELTFYWFRQLFKPTQSGF